MRLTSCAARRTAVWALTAMLLGASAPVLANAQSQQQALAAKAQGLVERAEQSYAEGVEALSRGDADSARRLFDEALDTILMSGVNLRNDSRLDTYYRDLVERIHRHEAQPGDSHRSPQRPEIAEPSLLDELSRISESELATVTPEGVKVYGQYDFDFSVAPPLLQFISYFVEGRGRSTMEAGLQRSGRYRQMVERVFSEERVPADLIWLAQAESVWKPRALSRAAAKGIWQFVPSTGLRYGLRQTAWIDERSNPEKSTRAAARYLKWLHQHFAGDWLLAMAAYNSGENRVDSAVARCGYADFWELHRRGLLPQETRNYVPIILAITIVSKNQKRYGFDVKPDPPLLYDTYDLPGQTDLKVVADLLGVPYDVIEELNAELRRGVSPPDERYALKIPKGTRRQFEIAYAALPEEQRVRKIVIPREAIAQSRSGYRTQLASYRVRGGDTLSAIARRHGVSVQDLVRLNRMSAKGKLRKGQTIRVPVSVRAGRGGKISSKQSRYVAKKVVRPRRAKARSSPIRRPAQSRRRR